MEEMIIAVLEEMEVQNPQEFLRESDAIEREMVQCLISIKRIVSISGEEESEDAIPHYEKIEELQSQFEAVLLKYNVNKEILLTKINDKLTEKEISPESAIIQE